MAENLVQHLLSQLPMPLSLISTQLNSIATCIFQFTLPFIAAITENPGAERSEGTSAGVSPILINAALLLFIFWLSLAIVGMASRYMYRMVMTMIKLGLFVVVSVIGFSLVNRGLVATQNDIMQFFGTVSTNRALNEQWERLNQAHGNSYGGSQ
ncbi:hypothetical protein L211DRAFT_290036 [Terfezia boudieri ATCC MYA-4762]|uniref:Uncharacterized protein n=1 Tax=Terfezia boudieri ATCC MYA-4762 TaxID=1051890 RepID=A0A3N4LJF0_9PEZI|nr:hypothetical protein L211DRAFT_290036 [Terfezia boudieri ATCC MYA-4762]